ncbi:hypothetical protein [Halosegnis marinus]|uniref:hypothetical protein n=1 Tax=Halosegnis marinus TaxID=3034023 RepID=UPI0036196107
MVEPLPTGTVALLLLLVVLPAYFFAAGPVGYAVLPCSSAACSPFSARAGGGSQ